METAFLHFKKHLEVEVFSSKEEQKVEQEFHAAMFLLTCEVILDREQDLAVRAMTQELGLKREYQVNKAGAYASLSSRLVGLFLSPPKELSGHLAKNDASMRLRQSVIRPNAVPVKLLYVPDEAEVLTFPNLMTLHRRVHGDGGHRSCFFHQPGGFYYGTSPSRGNGRIFRVLFHRICD